METPILLSSEIASLATGQTQEFPTAPMQNPFRRPMWVDEIRVQIPRTASIAAAWYAKIRLEARLGRVPLTNGFIPIGNLSIMGATYDTGTYYVAQWKLPKPLYVPATELVVVRARNVSMMGNTDAVRVMVAIAGRSISGGKEPASLNAPWVCFWEPGIAGYGLDSTQAAEIESTENDLVNPFDRELKVQRFIGRGVQDYNFNYYNGDFNGTTARLVTMQAFDSFGRIMARDPVPFTSMFFYGDNAWTVNSRLQPKGFYSFRVLNGIPGSSYTDHQWIGVSMIGHREIKLNGGL